MLHDIVNKYNNTVHWTIKIKPIDITSNSHAEYNENLNKINRKFKAGDHVTISKYKKISAKGYTKKFLLLVKLKTQFRVYMLLVIWMVKKLLEVSKGKNWQKTNQEKFRTEKVL